MCVIIIKNNDGKVDRGILERSSKKNGHGLGITWLDSWETEMFKSSDWEILDTDRPFIAHFRLASKGGQDLKHRHPFPIGNTECLLYQNGTVSNLGGDDETDTEHMARILAHADRSVWRDILEMTQSKWTIVDNKSKKYIVYNKKFWVKKGCALHSNSFSHNSWNIHTRGQNSNLPKRREKKGWLGRLFDPTGRTAHWGDFTD